MNKNLDYFISKSPYRDMKREDIVVNLSFIERMITSNNIFFRAIGNVFAFAQFVKWAIAGIVTIIIVDLVSYKFIGRRWYPEANTIELLGKTTFIVFISIGLSFGTLYVIYQFYSIIASAFSDYKSEIQLSILNKINKK